MILTTMRLRVRPLLTIACLAAVMMCGCGGGDSGPTRYTVSGKVTHQGKPVPNGFISFVPNTEKGNSGPGGGAPIVNGTYSAEKAKGSVGGPYLVKITGFDGVPYTEEGETVEEGKALFPTYEVEIDFPKQDSEQNFDVTGDDSASEG